MSYKQTFDRWFDWEAFSRFDYIDRAVVYTLLWMAIVLGVAATTGVDSMPAADAAVVVEYTGYLYLLMMFAYPALRGVAASDGATEAARRVAVRLGVSS